MPNWTSNYLSVELPDDASVREKVASKLFVKDDGEDTFTYNALIPMPDIVRHTGSGGRKFGGVTHTSWYNKEGEARPLTETEVDQLRKLGCTHWYDWSCNNWGVKWDASDVMVERYDDELIIRFESPWGPPDAWFRTLKEEFPGLEITLRYRLEDDDPYPHTL